MKVVLISICLSNNISVSVHFSTRISPSFKMNFKTEHIEQTFMAAGVRYIKSGPLH